MSRTVVLDRRDKYWAWAIGIGLAVHPIHNLWLTRLLTTTDGKTQLFLPMFGMLLWAMGTTIFLVHNWERVLANGWGDRKVFIPLLVIVGAIALSSATADGVGGKLLGLGMGLLLFTLYAVSRVLGRELVVPLAVGAAIASVGVISYAVWQPGIRTGGFVFENNYDIVVGYVLLGTALLVGRWRWLLVGLSLVAMFLTGSPEAVFAIGALGVIVLLRRDWSKKLAWVTASVIVIGVVYFALGHGARLYNYTLNIVRNQPDSKSGQLVYGGTVYEGTETRLGDRWRLITEAAAGTKPLGEGYTITEFKPTTVHNVPMVIVQQLGWPGILAGAAWVWVCVWGIWKTKWKYAWALYLILGVWDHFLWTQLSPFFWLTAGVTTTVSIENDYLFKEALPDAQYARRPIRNSAP